MKVSRRNVLLILILLIFTGFAVSSRRQFFRHTNVRAILSEGLDGRLIPHRVNRLETLTSVLDRDIRSMEIDVLFRAGADAGYFEVGHDEDDASGVRLDTFLDHMQPCEIEKIWLDMKNLGPANLPAAQRELQRLDSVYHIREIAIVEHYMRAPAVSSLAAAGFHTSYYLPVTAIAKLLDAGDATALAQRAQTLSAQVEHQAVRAVSFRLTIYPFVKAYLEPLLPPGIRYHAWDSVELKHWGAIDELKATDYFHDPRLDTIIYRL